MCWYRLASHLGLPLQEAMEKTTSREFVEWMAYLEMEWKERDKSEYYYALIAAEVRRSNVKDPRSVKLEDLLLTFKAGERGAPDQPRGVTGAEERMALSKAHWFGVTGVK